MRVGLVLGGAASVWVHAEEAHALGTYGVVVACNDIVEHWDGRIDAACTCHPEKWRTWLEGRSRRGFPPPERLYNRDMWRIRKASREHAEYVSSLDAIEVPWLFPEQKRSGSSGLFAVKVALDEEGCDRAVICGIPMSGDESHFFDEKPWAAGVRFRASWEAVYPCLKDRVRSMGGWTQELLGAPDADWVAGK